MACQKIVQKYATAYVNDVQARSDADETRGDKAFVFVMLAEAIRKCDTNSGEVISS